MFDDITKARHAKQARAAKAKPQSNQLKITQKDYDDLKAMPSSTLLLLLNPENLVDALEETVESRGLEIDEEIFNQVWAMICEEVDRRFPIPEAKP